MPRLGFAANFNRETYSLKPLETIQTVPAPPQRPIDAHKGTFGTVMVVGGCATMMGAPALCASAALRSGAGLVKIAAPMNVLAVALGVEPSATGVVLHENTTDSMFNLDQADTAQQAILAVGPGLGQSASCQELVDQLLRGNRTVVLDADGLNVLAKTNRPRPVPGPLLVVTPHPGEYTRLAKPLQITTSPTDPATRPAAAAQFALAQRAVVVLKGQHSVVSDGQHVYINHTGNPAMATAGSGDVLTGLIAALIAQHMTPLDAAVLGVYLHGLAADIWSERFGPSGLTASDLARFLPQAFDRHRNSR